VSLGDRSDDWADKDLSPYWQNRVLGVAVLLIGLLVLLWQAYVSGLPPEPVAATAPPALPARPAGAAVASPVIVPAPVSVSDRSTPLAADESEVCGVGRVKTARLGDPRELKIPVRQAVDRLTATLAQSPQEVLRAAGLAVQSAGLNEAPKPSPVCEGAACAASAADARTGAQAVADLPSTPRQALARMALGTRSPQVYALALQACSLQRTDGSCAMLSPDQWARLDPGNAIPWLQVAVDAQLRRDTATLDEAMFRMAHANTSDARFGTVTALAAVHMPGDVTLLAKHVVLTELIDAEAATVLQGYWVVRQYCSATSVRDANRQQTCAALADVLATKGTSLLDVSVGLMLGELVGWSPERVQAVSDERDAMMQIGVKSQPEPRHAWSCDALGKTTRDLTELGQYGEVGSLRRALRQSGESVAELARRQREALAAFNAAAAASAAASAP